MSTLDDELRVLDASAALLRRRRNALCPVNALHPEILSHIFTYLLHVEPPFREYPQPGRIHALGWAKVTHVCNFWRTVALENPQLWSCLTFAHDGSWVDTHIQRSASCPLRLRLSYYDTSLHSFGPILQHNAGRIEAIDIDHSFHSKAQYPETYYEWICNPNAVVRAFKCGSLFFGPTRPLPQVLFAGNAPRLSSLHIEAPLAKPFELIEPLLCNLSSLSLHRGWNKDPFRVRELYDFLTHGTGLRDLDLTGWMWSSGEGKLSSLERIELPRLRNYHIDGTLSESITIFKLLRLPTECSVTIGCRLQRRDDFSREMPRLARAITHNNGPFSNILTAEVASRRVPLKCYMISGWRQDYSTILMDDFTENGLPRSSTREPPACRIIFEQPPALNVKLEAFAPQVSAFFNLLPIKQLRNLSFRSSALEYEYTNWDHLRRECTVLQWLRIDKNIIRSFANIAAFARPYRVPLSVTHLALLNLYAGKERSLDIKVLRSILDARGQAALATVVTDGYKLEDLQEQLPDLQVVHVRRVMRGDREDKNE